MSIEDDQIIYVRTITTAKEAWNALKEHHEKGTLSNQAFVQRKICTTRLEEGGNMNEHLNTLSCLFQRLFDLNGAQQPTDVQKVQMILSSLPPSYDALIVALGARDEKQLTTALVMSKLKAEYSHRCEANGNNSETALKSVNSKSGGKSCFFCKKRGHIKNDCEKYKAW